MLSSRRQFLRNSVLTAAALPLLGCGGGENTGDKSATADQSSEKTGTDMPAANPLPYLSTIGLQLWSVRDQMAEDPELTLKTLKTVTSGSMSNPGNTPHEFTEVLDNAGEAGLSPLVFGYLPPEERTSADDWKRLADQLNEAGLQCKEDGKQLTYHNHNFEWDPIEGTTGFDILTERMDGDLVPWELDVFWAQIAGQDPKAIMTAAKDRLELLHLKQLHPGTPVVTRLADVPPNAFEELSDGNIPIQDLMHYGQEIGVKHCMVEQDGNYEGSSLKSVEKSLKFLNS